MVRVQRPGLRLRMTGRAVVFEPEVEQGLQRRVRQLPGAGGEPAWLDAHRPQAVGVTVDAGGDVRVAEVVGLSIGHEGLPSVEVSVLCDLMPKPVQFAHPRAEVRSDGIGSVGEDEEREADPIRVERLAIGRTRCQIASSCSLSA